MNKSEIDNLALLYLFLKIALNILIGVTLLCEPYRKDYLCSQKENRNVVFKMLPNA
jgi:hypothetical protein